VLFIPVLQARQPRATDPPKGSEVLSLQRWQYRRGGL